MLYSLFIFHVILNWQSGFVCASHFHNATLTKDSRAYVFIGGVYQSGTSVVERMLSSQGHSSGLFPTPMLQYNESALPCARWRYTGAIIDGRKEIICIAPENEGAFLTKGFQRCYAALHPRPCVPKSTGLWGSCAEGLHLTEHDCDTENREMVKRDWSLFWRNPHSEYYFEKDVSNVVKSRLLQDMYSDSSTFTESNGWKRRVGFIFLLRHPMSSCKFLRCDVDLHLQSWLRAYELLLDDLSHLQHFAVMHFEVLIQDSASFVQQLRKFLAWDVRKLDLRYSDKSSGSFRSEKKMFTYRRKGDESAKPGEVLRIGVDTGMLYRSKVNSKFRRTNPKLDPKSKAGINSNKIDVNKPTPLGKGYGHDSRISKGAQKMYKYFNKKRKPNTPLKRNVDSTLNIPRDTSKSGREKRRLLGFHGEEDQFTDKYDTTLLQTSESITWKERYSAALRDNVLVTRTLQKYSDRLQRFCYSIYNLGPIANCTAEAGVLMRSKGSMPLH